MSFRFNQNYGTVGIMDRLHGTDALFRKSKAYERHIVMLNLVPIKEIIPDDDKLAQKSCCTENNKF